MREMFGEYKNIFVCFFILTFLFYGNTLRNKYSLDDDYVTVTNFPVKGSAYKPNNPYIEKGFLSIPKIWLSRYAHDSEFSFDYRPVVTTTFAIEYGIFGQNPFISHSVNVFLYFILICLVFKVIYIILKDHPHKTTLSFLTAVLFLIHPLHTEVVASLKCRDEILALIFSLLALKNILSFLQKPTFKDAILAAVFMFLGFFSKLSAVLIIFSIPLVILFYRRIGAKKFILLVASVYFLYICFDAFSNLVPTEANFRNYYHFENPMSTEHYDFLHKLIIGIKTFGFYIQMMIIPYPLRYYYGYNTFDLSTNFNQYAIIALTFVIICFIYFYKTRDRNFLFGFLWLCLMLFPFLNIIMPVAGIVAERLTFISSLAFCFLMAIVILPFFSVQPFSGIVVFSRKPYIVLAPLILICLIYVMKRNSNWYNKLSLFEHDSTYLKNSAKANSLIANEYFETLRSPNQSHKNPALIQKGLHHYQVALKTDSSFFTAYNNAGVIYYSFLGDLNEAKKYFSLAIKHKSNYAQAFINLGNCFKQEKNLKLAFQNYKQAIISKPSDFGPYILCINLFLEAKHYEQCLRFIRFSHTQFPNNYDLITQEANCYYFLGDLRKSLKACELAYSLKPSPQLARYIAEQAQKLNDSTLAKKYTFN
jgi:tetratricopeptide (TPR) repeat protein